MFYSKKLKKEINISHCFFNRLGGKSKEENMTKIVKTHKR